MVLSRVLAEQWTYGFFGSIMAHSFFWPASIQQATWFTLTWLFVHSGDPPDGQLFIHSFHPAALWMGAILGWLFVKYFRTPRFVNINFVEAPVENLFFLSILLLTVAGHMIGTLADLFSKPSALPPTSDTAVIVTLAISAALGLMLFAYSVFKLVRTDHGITVFKYTVVSLLYIMLGNMVINEHWAVTVFATLLCYILMYVITLFLWAKRDTFFCPSRCRARRLALFWLWIFLFQMPIYLLGNLSDNCFAGANKALPPPDPVDCSLDEMVRTVFQTLSIASAVHLVVLLGLLLLAAGKRRPQACTLKNPKQKVRGACKQTC